MGVKVSAPANSAHFRWYTDIQCKRIIYMLDNNIVLWSIRNKTSEKIVRLHHSKVVIVITPWGWHEKSRIQISQKPQQFVGKMKCNTNRDVKATILCLTKTQLREIRPLEGNLLFYNLIPFWTSVTQPYGNFILWSNTDLLINMLFVYLPNFTKI